MSLWMSYQEPKDTGSTIQCKDIATATRLAAEYLARASMIRSRREVWISEENDRIASWVTRDGLVALNTTDDTERCGIAVDAVKDLLALHAARTAAYKRVSSAGHDYTTARKHAADAVEDGLDTTAARSALVSARAELDAANLARAAMQTPEEFEAALRAKLEAK